MGGKGKLLSKPVKRYVVRSTMMPIGTDFGREKLMEKFVCVKMLVDLGFRD